MKLAIRQLFQISIVHCFYWITASMEGLTDTPGAADVHACALYETEWPNNVLDSRGLQSFSYPAKETHERVGWDQSSPSKSAGQSFASAIESSSLPSQFSTLVGLPDTPPNNLSTIAGESSADLGLQYEVQRNVKSGSTDWNIKNVINHADAHGSSSVLEKTGWSRWDMISAISGLQSLSSPGDGRTNSNARQIALLRMTRQSSI